MYNTIVRLAFARELVIGLSAGLVVGLSAFTADATLFAQSLSNLAIGSPAAGSVVSGTITVTAVAGVPDIVGIQFLVDGANLGPEITAGLCSMTWDTNVSADGPHTLSVVGRDVSGSFTSSQPVPITVANGGAPPATDTQVPVVAFTAPANGTQVPIGTPVTVQATASDNVGVVSGTFVIAPTGTTGTPTAVGSFPLSKSWTPTAAGQYTMTVTATDAAGNIGSASLSITVTSPDTQAPAVAITSPANGTQVLTGTTVTVQASASDNVGVVSGTFAVALTGTAGTPTAVGPFPIARTWTPTTAGQYTVTVTARDAAGNVGSASVTITASTPPAEDGQAPVVTITSPPNGAQVTTGTAVTVQATASDNIGVASGTFSATLSGSAASPTAVGPFPISKTWTPTVAGQYTVTVTAKDAAGNVGTKSITITANAPPPPPTSGAPTITDVRVVSVTSTSATIFWRTNQPATTQVQYGLTTAYGSNSINETYVVEHRRTITGLKPNTTYQFRVRSRNAQLLSSVSGNFSFKTPGG